MNWIILLLAGLFEVSLTFCLGKARAASGLAFYLWGSGFLASTVLSASLSLDDKTIALAFPFLNENGIEFELDAVCPTANSRFGSIVRDERSRVSLFSCCVPRCHL